MIWLCPPLIDTLWPCGSWSVTFSKLAWQAWAAILQLPVMRWANTQQILYKFLAHWQDYWEILMIVLICSRRWWPKDGWWPYRSSVFLHAGWTREVPQFSGSTEVVSLLNLQRSIWWYIPIFPSTWPGISRGSTKPLTRPNPNPKVSALNPDFGP